MVISRRSWPFVTFLFGRLLFVFCLISFFSCSCSRCEVRSCFCEIHGHPISCCVSWCGHSWASWYSWVGVELPSQRPSVRRASCKLTDNVFVLYLGWLCWPSSVCPLFLCCFVDYCWDRAREGCSCPWRSLKRHLSRGIHSNCNYIYYISLHDLVFIVFGEISYLGRTFWLYSQLILRSVVIAVELTVAQQSEWHL